MLLRSASKEEFLFVSALVAFVARSAVNESFVAAKVAASPVPAVEGGGAIGVIGTGVGDVRVETGMAGVDVGILFWLLTSVRY